MQLLITYMRALTYMRPLMTFMQPPTYMRPLTTFIISFISFMIICVYTFAFIYAFGFSPKVHNPYQFRGAHINKVVKTWGTPDLKVNYPGGGTALIYHIVTYRNQVRATSGSPEIGVNVSPGGRPVIITNPTSSPITSPNMNRSLSLSCDIKFEANKQGIIQKVQMSGDGC